MDSEALRSIERDLAVGFEAKVRSAVLNPLLDVNQT